MPDTELLSLVANQMMTNAAAIKFDGKPIPIRKTSSQYLKTVKFTMKGHAYTAIEQNPDKPSRWGQLARDGRHVVQFKHDEGNKFVGGVSRRSGEGIWLRPSARLRRNPTGRTNSRKANTHRIFVCLYGGFHYASTASAQPEDSSFSPYSSSGVGDFNLQFKRLAFAVLAGIGALLVGTCVAHGRNLRELTSLVISNIPVLGVPL